MTRLLTGVLLTAVLWCGSGCGPRTTAASGQDPKEGANTAHLPTKAQPRLQTLKLFVGPTEITAELALSMDQIQTGMMFRTNTVEDEGMLFVFARPHRAAFWMKNVVVPLSCAYIDQDGQILEIHDMEPGNEKPIEAGSDRVMFVLETARGWFERHKVGVGMPVTTGLGTLRQSFHRAPVRQ